MKTYKLYNHKKGFKFSITLFSLFNPNGVVKACSSSVDIPLLKSNHKEHLFLFAESPQFSGEGKTYLILLTAFHNYCVPQK